MAAGHPARTRRGGLFDEQGHGKVWGDLPLPGAGGRTVRVVTSFHWGKEVPLFVRKVPGLGQLSLREAISEARRMIAGLL